MSRKLSPGFSFWILIMFMPFLWESLNARANFKEQEKPNIIFLLADDLRNNSAISFSTEHFIL
ncbi:MAG: hypothetical protein ACNS62_13300 [Candidatus Cyclobacteriaceae bacterium M3_2C_046]